MPDHFEALANRGNVLLDLGRNEEALVCARQGAGARAAPSAVARQSRQCAARARRGRGRDRANTTRRSALNPNDLKALFNRANALFRAGRYAESLAGYDRLLALAPPHPEALEQRAGWRLQALGPASGCARRAMPRRFRWPRITSTRISTRRWRCSRSATMRADLPNTSGAGSAPASRGAASASRSGSANIRSGRKTILLHAEQGLGDTIHVRPLCAAAGARRRDGHARSAGRAEGPAVRSRRRARVRAVARRCRRSTCIVRSAACRSRSRPRSRTCRPPFLICARARSVSPNGGRGSRRCRASASRSPGPATRTTSTIATARSRSARLRRCCPRPASSFVEHPARRAARATARRSTGLTHLGERACGLPGHRGGDRARAISSSRSIPRSRISPARWGGRCGCCCRSGRTGAGRSIATRSPWYPDARLFRQGADGDWDAGDRAPCGGDFLKLILVDTFISYVWQTNPLLLE